jgi:hypothetical protein
LEDRNNQFVYPKSVWRAIIGVLVLLFGIMYQFPMLGFFNNYPGQQLYYILTMNSLYFVVTIWLFSVVVKGQKDRKGDQ